MNPAVAKASVPRWLSLLALLRPQIDRFKALFPGLHRGDEVLLDHLPGGG